MPLFLLDDLLNTSIIKIQICQKNLKPPEPLENCISRPKSRKFLTYRYALKKKPTWTFWKRGGRLSIHQSICSSLLIQFIKKYFQTFDNYDQPGETVLFRSTAEPQQVFLCVWRYQFIKFMRFPCIIIIRCTKDSSWRYRCVIRILEIPLLLLSQGRRKVWKFGGREWLICNPSFFLGRGFASSVR